MLVATKDYAQLDRLTLRAGAASFFVVTVGALVLQLVVSAVWHWLHPLAHRLLPPLPTCFLLVATVLLQITIPQSLYLRAHKVEPLLLPSLAGGLLMALLTLGLGRPYGPTGAAAGYLAVTAFVGLPAVTLIWLRRRREWRACGLSIKAERGRSFSEY